jgi:hypothetical protein
MYAHSSIDMGKTSKGKRESESVSSRPKLQCKHILPAYTTQKPHKNTKHKRVCTVHPKTTRKDEHTRFYIVLMTLLLTPQ